MHARVAFYRLTSGSAEEVATKAKEGMLPIFRQESGFVSYELIAANGTIVSITRWQSHEGAEAATQDAASWVRENIADLVELQQNYVGDVMLSS
jgi:quinol monooxygenase YgiN